MNVSRPSFAPPMTRTASTYAPSQVKGRGGCGDPNGGIVFRDRGDFPPPPPPPGPPVEPPASDTWLDRFVAELLRMLMA